MLKILLYRSTAEIFSRISAERQSWAELHKKDDFNFGNYVVGADSESYSSFPAVMSGGVRAKTCG